MKAFARLLNALYFSYSHLQKMKLLQHFFAETLDPERGYAVAVLANTLNFPTFGRTLIRELIKERVDPYFFSLSNDFVGDVAETLSLIWPRTIFSAADLPTLPAIIERVNTLPNTEIVAYLTSLLDSSEVAERWALLKLGTGSLRVGVSSRFIKKALAQYGGVSLAEVEHIWSSLQPPYLELFAWLEGKTSRPALQPHSFHPIMLSNPLTPTKLPLISSELFVAEYKYDGIRVQVVNTPKGKALYSRTGDNICHSFPEILEAFDSLVVLDGELILQEGAELASFNDLQQRLNRKTPSQRLIKEKPAMVLLYDILFKKGEDLRALPFSQRRAHLVNWFESTKPARMQLSPLLDFENTQSLCDLREKILSQKNPAIEGLMLKRKDSPYIAGRPIGHWYKWKRDPYLVDAVLMYAQRGHGKRSSFYSDYTFGLWAGTQLLPIGKAYFGFTDEELYQLDKWIRYHTINQFGPVKEVEKSLVFEVAFDKVQHSTRHKSGIALRFPRIHRIRWDKPASEADHLEMLFELIAR